MKKLVLCCTGFVCLFTARAQKTEDSVRAAVNDLFIAMARSDSAGVVNAFSSNAILQTITEKDGKTAVETTQVNDFAHVIGGLTKGDANEEIKFNTIKIDGPLALAWMPYNLFFKGAFSHCGVDCFCLVRTGSGWKIQYIIDTRRKDGCK